MGKRTGCTQGLEIELIEISAKRFGCDPIAKASATTCALRGKVIRHRTVKSA